MSTRHYRPEIDGLRALAVVPVILFHAGLPAFSGGFVGVDIFFVISGYLITSIVIKELEQGRFSFGNFYERRARRILPALLLVMLCSIPFAWRWMMPDELKDFAQSLLAVLLFSSNLLFWQESGYFDGEADLKPLLHTWSLGVEEQFYLLFPLSAWLAWRCFRRHVSLFYVALLLVSLLASQWRLADDASSAFYLLPFRAWELLLGALLALHEARAGGRTAPRRGELSGTAGLVLILASLASFGKETPFPGLAALLPTLGTLLVIHGASSSTVVGKLLGQRLLVGIGLISYSAYLWHQVLFALARLYTFSTAHIDVYKILALLSFALAFISWKYVEGPFRSASRVPLKLFIATLAMATLTVAGFGLAAVATDGFEAHFNRSLDETQRLYHLNARESARLKKLGENHISHGECIIDSPSVSELFLSQFQHCARSRGKALLVIGDSHSGNLFRALASAPGRPDFLIRLGRGSCRPADQQAKCDIGEMADFLLTHKEQISAVLFAQSGFYLLQGARRESILHNRTLLAPDQALIDRTLEFLIPISEAMPTYWFGPWIEPHLPLDNPRRMATTALDQLDFSALNRDMFAQLDRSIAQQASARAPLLHYRSQVREEGTSADFIPLHVAGCITFRDSNHLSPCGERLMGQKMLDRIAR